MMHRIPDTDVVNREEFILEKCHDKVVIHFGCQGPLHRSVVYVAKESYGVDIVPGEGIVQLNVEKDILPTVDNVELVLCGEILEHLSLPGLFIEKMSKTYKCPILLTVPNAHSTIGYKQLCRGFENVNSEHVAYYSYYTIKELFSRYNYEIKEYHWYNGKPVFAEGLIFMLEQIK
jgi:hypothetical protein